MKKILSFIGASLYAVVFSYLIWLAFHYLSPWVMSWRWIYIILFWILSIGGLVGIVMSLAGVLFIPLQKMISICPAGKWIPVLALLFFCFSATREVWIQGTYHFKEVVIGISLTIDIVTIYISFIVALFKERIA